MLGKLLKYETKATVRWYGPIYVGIILLSLINKLFMIISESAAAEKFLDSSEIIGKLFYLAQGIATFGYVVAIVGAFVLSVVLAIYRFYKNLLGDEGYLMFTLPAKPSQHIWSKLIISMMWIILSAVVTLISLFIIFFEGNIISYISEFFGLFMQALGTPQGVNAVFIFIEIIVLVLVGLSTMLLMLYASMATGHLKQNHRILYSFAAYIVFNVIMQVITGVIMVIGATVLSSAEWFTAGMQLNGDTSITFVHVVLIGVALFSAAFAAAYYAITNHILKTKLNLE